MYKCFSFTYWEYKGPRPGHSLPAGISVTRRGDGTSGHHRSVVTWQSPVELLNFDMDTVTACTIFADGAFTLRIICKLAFNQVVYTLKFKGLSYNPSKPSRYWGTLVSSVPAAQQCQEWNVSAGHHLTILSTIHLPPRYPDPLPRYQRAQ